MIGFIQQSQNKSAFGSIVKKKRGRSKVVEDMQVVGKIRFDKNQEFGSDRLADLGITRKALGELHNQQRIKIGRKFVPFKVNDSIFKITEAVQPKKNEKNCVFCERDMTDLE